MSTLTADVVSESDNQITIVALQIDVGLTSHWLIIDTLTLSQELSFRLIGQVKVIDYPAVTSIALWSSSGSTSFLLLF